MEATLKLPVEPAAFRQEMALRPLLRRGAGLPPRLIFTADFHELLRGDLVPGPCVVHYDPFRIIPREEFDLGLPVTIHMRFHPGGELWAQTVSPAPGALQPHLADLAGQGYVLKAKPVLPPDAEELECWFSYLDNTGQTRWDSAGGRNFWLRFPNFDLTILSATVNVGEGTDADRFHLSVAAVAAVDDMIVRWRYARPGGQPRQESHLTPVDNMDGRKVWATQAVGLPVPQAATVIFDLVYGSGGHYTTDDNEGTWYIVAPTPT